MLTSYPGIFNVCFYVFCGNERTNFSEAVMIGLPYGTISARLSSGEKMEIANTLRRHQNEVITQMYGEYLDGLYGPDNGYMISRSSMWQILDACSASRKKAIAGLDEFIANGRDVSLHKKCFQQCKTCNII